MNEITTDMFEDAFISIMNILRKMEHVLFAAIVTNKDGKSKYPMNRAWCDLGPLTIAWHIHHPCPDESEDDLFAENIEKEVVDSNDNGSELNELNLEDNRHENAFGTIMHLLAANNFPLFEQIVVAASASNEKSAYDDGYEEDCEITKLGYAWKIYCDQNVNKCSVEGFKATQKKTFEKEKPDIE